MKTPRKIMAMPVSEITKYVNKIQMRILVEHHGSEVDARKHISSVNSLIPEADKYAKNVDPRSIHVDPWQTVSVDNNGRIFKTDIQSIAFHREMDRLKREHLGMGVAA